MENPNLPQENMEGKEQIPSMRKVLLEYLTIGPRSIAEGLMELNDATLGKIANEVIELAEKLKKAKENK